MSDRSNIVYLYDGSFDGLLCCVFDSYVRHEIPMDILTDDAPQVLLYETRFIISDHQKADRIYTSILKKMGNDAEYLIKIGFLCALNAKSLIIYNFIRLGYTHGFQVSNMLADTTVSSLHNMVKAVQNEKHMLLGFVRFSEYNGCLVSVIEPKHFVLPLMKGHFCARFSGEQFMIYDKTHQVALIYRPYEAKIIEVEHLELPCEDEIEEKYRRLWTQYYNTIAIKERENPKCRMGHMPKRYWLHLTEMTTDLSPQKQLK
ncbi:MAG: TIGR03915 family putative DNA repair protein [Oscillospiraceae bacterium]